MGNTVGTDGLAAIRDFVKPYVISESDISNSTEIREKWDIELSAIVFGHTAIHYVWTIDSTKLSTALKWNFWEVTEFTGENPIILHKTTNDTYQGSRRVNSYQRYLYIVTVYSDYCDVWVYGITIPYDSEGNAEPLFNITNLFTFTQEEMVALFGQLMSGASFVFTKTDSDTSGIELGSNADKFYLRMPLDISGTSVGYIVLKHCASMLTTSSSSLSGFNLKWIGNSYFFNRHQIWVLSLDWTTSGSKSLTLINTQDLAIQSLSASEYANLSTKDPNTLYFVPEE